MSVYDTARRLERKIKDSDEYREYLELREKVMSKEGSKKMLLDYQNLMTELQTKQLSGQEISEEEKEKLNNLNNFIEINNNVKKYLEAEYKVSVMLNDLQKIIFSDIEIGIPSEEEDSQDEEE
ncbi:MAG: YlbF family regulator [Bacillota bacterium]